MRYLLLILTLWLTLLLASCKPAADTPTPQTAPTPACTGYTTPFTLHGGSVRTWSQGHHAPGTSHSADWIRFYANGKYESGSVGLDSVLHLAAGYPGADSVIWYKDSDCYIAIRWYPVQNWGWMDGFTVVSLSDAVLVTGYGTYRRVY